MMAGDSSDILAPATFREIYKIRKAQQSILNVRIPPLPDGFGGSCRENSMTESKSNRFTKYFPLLLDALRSTHPTPMRPAGARAWIRSKLEVPAEDLTRLIENGNQSIFENDVHWARFYLAKANLIGSPKRG